MKVLCGYNINLDAIYSIDGGEVSRLINEVDATELHDKILHPPGVINSLCDLVAGLIYCMKDGRGAEWFIRDVEVFDLVKKRYLSDSMMRIGGNMGIMANVLSRMGAQLVVPNMVGDTRHLQALLPDRGVLLPEDFDAGRPEVIHFVFDFTRGDSFEFEDEVFVIPRENRFIASYDDLNSRLSISPFFRDYALKHLKEMDGAIISGFHQLQKSYPEGKDYSFYFNRVIDQLEQWAPSDLFIHAEMGHFADADMARYVFRGLSGRVSSIGMNEDELAMLYGIHHVDVKRIEQMDAPALMDACVECMKATDIDKMIVHTRDLVLFMFRDGMREREFESMQFGIRCAGVFAATGLLPERDGELPSELVLSEHGLQEIRRVPECMKCEGGVCSIHKGFNVCIAPTLICERPISTVGLGDTISAAMFLRWLELS